MLDAAVEAHLSAKCPRAPEQDVEAELDRLAGVLRETLDLKTLWQIVGIER